MQLDKTRPILQINKLRTFFLLLLLLFSIFFTAGCWNNLEVNETAEAEGMVFDLDGDQPSFSVQLAKPLTKDQAGSASAEPINITQTGRTYSEAARKLMLSLPRLPIWAHAGVVIFGNDLASSDLARAVDFIARNRNVRKSALVFISKGATGRECLDAHVPLEAHSSSALKRLIRIEEQQLGIYMPVTLDKFLEKLATPGIEAVAPQLIVQEVEGQKQLRLDGTAVFKDRKVVGSLNESESRGLRFLSPKFINGGLIIIPSPLAQNSLNNDKMISIELTRSQATVSPQIEANGIIRMKINIDAEGNFYEQTFTGDVLTLDNIKIIQELVNESIQGDIKASIMKAQVLDSDIFGWGQSIYRHDPALWEQFKNDWPAIFPGVQADITVNFNLRRTYLLDHSFEFQE